MERASEDLNRVAGTSGQCQRDRDRDARNDRSNNGGANGQAKRVRHLFLIYYREPSKANLAIAECCMEKLTLEKGRKEATLGETGVIAIVRS